MAPSHPSQKRYRSRCCGLKLPDWLLGDLDSHNWICRSIANKADYAVVNVDYRMAPPCHAPLIAPPWWPPLAHPSTHAPSALRQPAGAGRSKVQHGLDKCFGMG